MPAKHAKELSETYAEVAGGYEQRNNPESLSSELIEVIRLFLEQLSPESVVLDLGAGTGRDAEIFHNNGIKVTLFDLSPQMLEIAKTRLPEVEAVIGDMTELPFSPGSFDGVWANCSLLHLTKDEAKTVLESVHTLLKTNGFLGVIVKEGGGEEVVKDNKYGKPMTRFFSFYTVEELQVSIEQAGFHVQTTKTFSSERSGTVYLCIIARKKEL